MYKIILISVIALYLIIFGIYLKANKVLVKGVLLNALSGIVLLSVLKLIDGYLGIGIFINSVTVFVAAVFGAPGVVLNLLIDYAVI